MKIVISLLILALGIGWWIANSGKQSAPVPKPEEVYEPLHISSLFISDAHASDFSDRTTPRSIGEENAPVTLYVFSSLMCGHCADFHINTMPVLEEKYVKTGKAKMVYIDLPGSDKFSFGGAMVARCLPKEKYFQFLEILFENQGAWVGQDDGMEKLELYATVAGMNRGAVKACLQDERLMRSLASKRDESIRKYELKGTPSVVVEKGKEWILVDGGRPDKIEEAFIRLEQGK